MLSSLPVQEQLSKASGILIMVGIGGILGGQAIAQVNDRSAQGRGPRNAALVTAVWVAVVYSLFFFCNEHNEYGLLCYLSSICLGALDFAFITQIQIIMA
jgi:predicted MFS family arabinose efflux permease